MLHGTAEHSVVTGAIHRAIEYHAATKPETLALADGERTMSFRQLNTCANVLARQLMTSGLRRTNVALVRMERSIDLAGLLLAVLKTGAAYCWIDPSVSSSWPLGMSILSGGAARGEQRCLAIAVPAAPTGGQSAPNLPVMTRGSDAACLLADTRGNPAVVVPHATVCGLPLEGVLPVTTWDVDDVPFALWFGLVAGATVIVRAGTTAAAA